MKEMEKEKKLSEYNGKVVIIDINDDISDIHGKYIGLLYGLMLDSGRLIYFLASPCDYNSWIINNGVYSFNANGIGDNIELAMHEDITKWGEKHKEYFKKINRLNDDEITIKNGYLNELLIRELIKDVAEALKDDRNKKSMDK